MKAGLYIATFGRALWRLAGPIWSHRKELEFGRRLGFATGRWRWLIPLKTV